MIDLNKVKAVLKSAATEIEMNTCLHEETYRGGVLWEICSQCGDMWADDEGGKPEFGENKVVLEIYEILHEIEENQMNTMAKLLMEYHSKQSNVDNLRFGQFFCNNYIDGDWSDLYYETDITVAVRKIDQWLRDNGKLQKMPKCVQEEKPYGR